MVSTESSPRLSSDWRNPGPLELSPILTGAVKVFHERGYHGASVRDIAQRVGVTVPALYYHYESKQAMLVALLETGIGDLLDRAELAVREAGDDTETRFGNLIEAIVLHMTQRLSLAFLDSELRYLAPDNRRHYAAMRKKLEKLLLNIIEQGRDDGLFHVRHPADTARAILGMCQSVATWYKPRGRQSASDTAAHYAEIALQAVGARARTGSRRGWRPAVTRPSGSAPSGRVAG
jgi:AcrR family transcriptional regulator